MLILMIMDRWVWIIRCILHDVIVCRCDRLLDRRRRARGEFHSGWYDIIIFIFFLLLLLHWNLIRIHNTCCCGGSGG